ncbi:hypothetical protein K435DRAFT_853606 [Dendrothele bispora CBS 962.96]|uniref:Uncharacterized protein n=1 Tax=Dendrothele bispora (strain CBS 962.96) TaxID=1314807 RepID=A0A4S8MGI1_DENBC|nr:hypothetical protein K435DRAFT_853606 [Dendrothele bispora CBS 962.96]
MPVQRCNQDPMTELVDGYPRYIDPKMAPDTRRMTFIVLNQIPRFRNIHVCREGGYHLIKMDVMWISPMFHCDRCEVHVEVDQMTRREREFLCTKYPEYRQGYIDLSTVDLVAHRSSSSSTTAAPPPRHPTPIPLILPAPPTEPPSAIHPSIRAPRTRVPPRNQGQTATIAPPPPYSPPRLAIAGFTGSGHSANPVDIDSVPGNGTRSDPINLAEGEWTDEELEYVDDSEEGTSVDNPIMID